MAPSYHGSCTNRAFQGKALTHLRKCNNKSRFLVSPQLYQISIPTVILTRGKAQVCPASLIICSFPTLPLLSFSLHFLCFGTFPVSAAHLVPAVTFTFLCIPLLSKEDSCTPFWGLSGYPSCLSCITSSPEGAGLPHLPRMNN